MKTSTRNLLSFLALFLISGPASACAVCFAGKDSNLTYGMNLAIFTMLIVLFAVLTAFAVFFSVLIRRSEEGEPDSA